MKITVFGGSNPNEPDYQAALELGRMIGSTGDTVLTGGYIGTMEAVSRGTAETNGHVIGITCDQIERWRPVRPNKWIMEEIRFSMLQQRIMALIELCDAAIALPGGAGTLAEITMMWNLLIIGSIQARPLILVGAGWEHTFQMYYTTFGKYIPNQQRTWIQFASSGADALHIAREHLSLT